MPGWRKSTLRKAPVVASQRTTLWELRSVMRTAPRAVKQNPVGAVIWGPSLWARAGLAGPSQNAPTSRTGISAQALPGPAAARNQ